jgi:hypothetical protein
MGSMWLSDWTEALLTPSAAPPQSTSVMAQSLHREVLLALAPNPQLLLAAVAPRQPPSKLLRETWPLTMLAQPHQPYQLVSTPRGQLLTPLQKEQPLKRALSP